MTPVFEVLFITCIPLTPPVGLPSGSVPTTAPSLDTSVPSNVIFPLSAYNTEPSEILLFISVIIALENTTFPPDTLNNLILL